MVVGVPLWPPSTKRKKESLKGNASCSVALNRIGLKSSLRIGGNCRKADLAKFNSFVSDGVFTVEKSVAETPVTVLRDTASGQSVMVAGAIDLPKNG